MISYLLWWRIWCKKHDMFYTEVEEGKSCFPALSASVFAAAWIRAGLQPCWKQQHSNSVRYNKKFSNNSKVLSSSQSTWCMWFRSHLGFGMSGFQLHHCFLVPCWHPWQNRRSCMQTPCYAHLIFPCTWWHREARWYRGTGWLCLTQTSHRITSGVFSRISSVGSIMQPSQGSHEQVLQF